MSGLVHVLELEHLIPAHVTGRSVTRSMGYTASCSKPWSQPAKLGLSCLLLCAAPVSDPYLVPELPLSCTSSPSLTHLEMSVEPTVER